MAYSDFSLEEVVIKFNLVEQDEVLFPQVQPLKPSSWLQETLDYSLDLALVASTEKARSEFITAPVLLELGRRNPQQVSIYSGKRLDADCSSGLTGECDFILSRGQLSYIIQMPIFGLVEARKQDIDLSLGQGVAQMLGAQMRNHQKNNSIDVIFGCVTTGEAWQFMRLKDKLLAIDRDIYYINQLEQILGILQAILDFYR